MSPPDYETATKGSSAPPDYETAIRQSDFKDPASPSPAASVTQSSSSDAGHQAAHQSATSQNQTPEDVSVIQVHVAADPIDGRDVSQQAAAASVVGDDQQMSGAQRKTQSRSDDVERGVV